MMRASGARSGTMRASGARSGTMRASGPRSGTMRASGARSGLKVPGAMVASGSASGALKSPINVSGRSGSGSGSGSGSRPGPPRLAFSPGGRILSGKSGTSNVSARMKKAVCASSLAPGSRGFRDPAFRACFLKYLQNRVAPMFAKAKGAVGNVAQMNSMCTQASLAPHQVVVYEIAKLMAAVPPERLGEHRALLTWASTGSGKTVTSLGIIMAFWNTKKKLLLVSSKSNTDQALASYVREAPRFFPTEFKSIVAEYKKSRGASHLGDLEAFGVALYERVKGLTFRMARNRIAPKKGEFKTIKEFTLDSGEGSVLIIDEAQGLSMRDKTDPMGDAIRLGCALRSLSPEKMRKINVFAMTATPGNTIKQWLKLLSIVRRADQRPFTLDNDTGRNSKGGSMCAPPVSGSKDDALAIENILKKALQNTSASPKYLEAIKNHVNREFFGLVSYVDIRSDMSRHACVEEIEMPVQLDKDYFLLLLKCNIEDRLRLRHADTREVAQHEYSAQFPNMYMNKMRKLGNILPKTLYDKLPNDTLVHMRKNGRILEIGRKQLRLVSPKFAMLADFTSSKPGKHYVYVLTPNQDILAMALVKWHKMNNVTRLADQYNKARADSVTKKVVGMQPSPTKSNFVVLSDSTDRDHRARLVSIFNSPDNADGSYIRVVIATGQLYEGLDLVALRYVSLGDVLASPLQESQAIGRGVRNCSHRGLAMKDRRVTIVRWFSMAPSGGWDGLMDNLEVMKGLRGRIGPDYIKEEYDRIRGKSYDRLVFIRSRKDPDFNVLANFERIMKTAALDCAVLAPFHPGSSCSVVKLSNSNPLSAGTRCTNIPP